MTAAPVRPQDALAGASAPGEDLKDHPRAVHHLDLPGLFQIALLDWRQGVVDDRDVDLELKAELPDLVDLAAAEQRRRRALAQGRDDRVPDFQVERQRKADGLVQTRL